MRNQVFAVLAALLPVLGIAPPTAAQTTHPSLELVVDAGRPLRVALDERVRIERVGQVVTGRITEPVFAYDRIVIPAGTRVRGHVARIDSVSKFARTRAYLTGNFSPDKHVVVQFDELLPIDGRIVRIDTTATGGIARVTRATAGDDTSRDADHSASIHEATDDDGPQSGVRSQMKHATTDAVAQARQKLHDMMASAKAMEEPGKMRRLEQAAVQQLPYHPQYLEKGTVYDAQLVAPLDFGRVIPAAAAPAGTAPAPDSIVTARLATTLDSSKTPRGTRFEAVIIKPVFSADHEVVLPEGTRLFGEVTYATPARRLHRNGRLRFLFERVEVPNQSAAQLLGELHAIDASADARVRLDDEGGATIENSKTRFIAPALALLSLRASMEHDGDRYPDPDGDGTMRTRGSGGGRGGLSRFFGMGVVGVALGHVTHPLGFALGVYGAARTVYSNILGKGREVTFAADTPIEVRLAPGPSKR